MGKLKQKLKKLVPTGLRNKLTAFRNRIFGAHYIKKWRTKGSPLPPPHQYKQKVIADYAEKFQCKILVETGTLRGDMIEAQRKNFNKLYSVELNHNFWVAAVKRFKKHGHIEIVEGDSSKVLEEITKKLTEKTLFWLDGHYSAGDTARGEKDCPIYGEIDAIFKQKDLRHILIIDDAGSFVGKDDYPTIEELTNYIHKYNNDYKLISEDGIIRYIID